MCLQYHMAIGPPWGIPMHYNCRCRQVRIPPGGQGEPFVDFHQILEDMTPDQQAAAVGSSVMKLIEAGDITFEDAVSPLRVRTLRELVAIHHLTVQELVDAGIPASIAEAADAAVHTPEATLIAEHRAELVAMAAQAGVSQDQLTALLAEVVAGRVMVAEGPNETGTFLPSWDSSRLRAEIPHADELAAVMWQWERD
jgi:hypothetical protein